jgi:hypothetical protein
MGRDARKYKVEVGIPKRSSNLTNTTPNKKADRIAPNPSIRNSLLGFAFNSP